MSDDFDDQFEALIRAADETGLNMPTLTSKLSKLNPKLRELLRAWYRSKDVPSRAIASLWNSLATERLGCFLITRDLFLALIKADANQTNRPGLTHKDDLRAVMAKLVRSGFRVVVEQRGQAACIMEVTNPKLIELFGLDAGQIQAQKAKCLELRGQFDETTGQKIKGKKTNSTVEKAGWSDDEGGSDTATDTASDTATDTLPDTRCQIPSTNNQMPNTRDQIPDTNCHAEHSHEGPQATSEGLFDGGCVEVSEAEATEEPQVSTNIEGDSELPNKENSAESHGRAAVGGLERSEAERTEQPHNSPSDGSGTQAGMAGPVRSEAEHSTPTIAAEGPDMASGVGHQDSRDRSPPNRWLDDAGALLRRLENDDPTEELIQAVEQALSLKWPSAYAGHREKAERWLPIARETIKWNRGFLDDPKAMLIRIATEPTTPELVEAVNAALHLKWPLAFHAERMDAFDWLANRIPYDDSRHVLFSVMATEDQAFRRWEAQQANEWVEPTESEVPEIVAEEAQPAV